MKGLGFILIICFSTLDPLCGRSEQIDMRIAKIVAIEADIASLLKVSFGMMFQVRTPNFNDDHLPDTAQTEVTF